MASASMHACMAHLPTHACMAHQFRIYGEILYMHAEVSTNAEAITDFWSLGSHTCHIQLPTEVNGCKHHVWLSQHRKALGILRVSTQDLHEA